MGDCFYVRGFRKVTNNSFICLSFTLIPIPFLFPHFPLASYVFLTLHFSPSSCTLVSLPLPPLQPYYTNRASLPPSSGPRGVPPSSGPRPVTPTHVYQAGPGSQMMMIPGQQLPFPSSPQGPAYFIPGQVGGTDWGGVQVVILPNFPLIQARWHMDR